MRPQIDHGGCDCDPEADWVRVGRRPRSCRRDAVTPIREVPNVVRGASEPGEQFVASSDCSTTASLTRSDAGLERVDDTVGLSPFFGDEPLPLRVGNAPDRVVEDGINRRLGTHHQDLRDPGAGLALPPTPAFRLTDRLALACLVGLPSVSVCQ